MRKYLLALFLVSIFVISSSMAYAGVKSSTFHGQFRINSYNQSQDSGDKDSSGKDVGSVTTAASRLRYRPTWDVAMDGGVAMHMQLNIGHINSNTSNARFDKSGTNPAVGLRHAYVLAPVTEGVSLIGGLVPLSDKFGDTLFSGDWDFNPLTYALLIKAGGADIRAGYATLAEGSEANNQGTGKQTDDLSAYVLDVDAGGFGASYYYIAADDAHALKGSSQSYYGARYSGDFGGIGVNAFILGNGGTFKKGIVSATEDVSNSGMAGKLEVKVPVGSAKIGVMGIYASGNKDTGKGFITPLQVIDHHGYWGYTGKLNIQGPTDTGIDDPVRIDGSKYGDGGTRGYGLTTVQANVDFPVADNFSVYGAVGTFSQNDVPSGQEKNIGTDVYLQGNYGFGGGLNLQFGGDFASLDKGYTRTSKTGSTTLLFARFQLEY
ncbi:MAG: hypothetical protein HY279_11860 [Nitrospinae bacterium]|nr:hypothetical protein [Nitrospinota bacterium]